MARNYIWKNTAESVWLSPANVKSNFLFLILLNILHQTQEQVIPL